MNMAMPMMLAQLINLLYSVVDRVYIGRIPDVGTLALTGLGVTFPIINILNAFANLFGMGGAPLCSIARGRGEKAEAGRIMQCSYTLLLISGVALTALGYLFLKPLLYLFGASDATYPYARDYMLIYLAGTLFVMVSLGMNNFINSQGFGRVGMLSVLSGAVANLVLDPIFIFAFGMGVRGAAIATVLSQGLSAAWVLCFLSGKKAILRLKPTKFFLQGGMSKQITARGFSGFTMSATNSAVQILCNAQMQAYGGDLYVGVMTILNSVRDILTMPVNGLTSGAQPVLGFNYGAQAYRRVKKGIVFMTLSCMAYTLVAWLLVFLFPQFFIQILFLRVLHDDLPICRAIHVCGAGQGKTCDLFLDLPQGDYRHPADHPAAGPVPDGRERRLLGGTDFQFCGRRGKLYHHAVYGMARLERRKRAYTLGQNPPDTPLKSCYDENKDFKGEETCRTK